MATSLSYNFAKKFTVISLVEQAFWMLGIPPEKLVPRDVDNALMIANLELAMWSSQNQILSLIQRQMMDLKAGQSFYTLPDPLLNVYECTIANYTRLRFAPDGSSLGTPIASQGDATPCFTPLSDTGLTQTSPNGWIGFEFSSVAGLPVWYIGVRPLTFQNYTLAIEYSYDGTVWLNGLATPSTDYIPLQNTWWIYESPPNAPYWRIRETKGGILAIQQIYFAQPSLIQNDQSLGSLSSDQFMQLSKKMYPNASPSGFYFNNSRVKSIYLYGNNYENFTSMIYSAQMMAQDIDKLFQNIDLATKLWYPLSVAMALELSISYAPEKYAVLEKAYQRVVPTSLRTDREQVDITFEHDMASYWAV